jgi:acetyl esterase
VEDQWIETGEGALALRFYRPRSGPDRLPATVYYHGGGFVIGNLASHDSVCRRLAVGSGSVVIAVDYRLAPEHPFPAAPTDACTAFRWVHRNAQELGIDAARIAVAGDSAGGNLAAVVCQTMRAERQPMPSFQLLLYPAVDLTRSSESYRTFADGYLLTARTMDWFVASYLTDAAQELDPRGSPLMTRELSGLPPAHVTTAGFDPLRDEGEAYATGLMAAGVPTTARCYESLIHGYMGLGGLSDASAHALDDATQALRRHHWR